MSVELWYQKYKPTTIDEYVWKDNFQRNKVEEWIASGVLPHVLFSGGPGTGKSSLADLLMRLLNIPNGDILKKNASKDRKIDDLQSEIVNFASTWALNDSGFKYVLLDEADSLTPLAQRFLRGEMDRFEDSCRFIFTANYENRITEPLHSRVQEMKFFALEKDECIVRAGEILTRENIEFDINDLIQYIEITYPDLRKCIGLLQQNSYNNVLRPPPAKEEITTDKDYLLEAILLFKEGKLLEGRKFLVSKAQIEEYPTIFRYFYQNIEIWGETQDQQDDALLIIRRGILNHSVCVDSEINLSATICELTRLMT